MTCSWLKSDKKKGWYLRVEILAKFHFKILNILSSFTRCLQCFIHQMELLWFPCNAAPTGALRRSITCCVAKTSPIQQIWREPLHSQTPNNLTTWKNHLWTLCQNGIWEMRLVFLDSNQHSARTRYSGIIISEFKVESCHAITDCILVWYFTLSEFGNVKFQEFEVLPCRKIGLSGLVLCLSNMYRQFGHFFLASWGQDGGGEPRTRTETNSNTNHFTNLVLLPFSSAKWIGLLICPKWFYIDTSADYCSTRRRLPDRVHVQCCERQMKNMKHPAIGSILMMSNKRNETRLNGWKTKKLVKWTNHSITTWQDEWKSKQPEGNWRSTSLQSSTGQEIWDTGKGWKSWEFRGLGKIWNIECRL